MKKRGAIVTVIILSLLFVSVPAFVIFRTLNLENGWKGLPWGASEQQTRSWVEKNNNKASWQKCNLTHFGVSCYKVTWKESKASPFEYLEFQFKNNRLVAVIESSHSELNNPVEYLNLNRSGVERGQGTDLSNEIYKEKGTKYKLSDRVFYYNVTDGLHDTRIRYAVQSLIRINLSDNSEPDTVINYQLTTGYFSRDYYEEAKTVNENFPSFRFLSK